MVQLGATYNTTGNEEGLNDYTPIPAGDVIAFIKSSEKKETKAGTGHYIQVIWNVCTGENKGRLLFDNLNIDNPNPLAVEIANKTINSICKAAGKVGVQDSQELHNIPIKLTLSVQPATKTQPASNNIKAYTALTPEEIQAITIQESSGSSSPPKVETPPPTPEVKGSNKLPWE